MIVAVAFTSACSGVGGSAPTSTSAPVPTVPPHPPQSGLARLLIAAPAGSRMGRSAWAADYTPTPAQFVSRYYPAAAKADVLARLREQGIRHIAHTLWVTNHAVDADIMLLQFRTARGALSRLIYLTSASRRDTKLVSYRLALHGRPIVFYDKTLDDLGDVIGKVYTRVGNVVVEIYVGSPARLDKNDIAKWTKAQLARLSAA